LVLWKKGDSSSKIIGDDVSQEKDSPLRFVSLFGKTRHHSSFFEQHRDEQTDYIDDYSGLVLGKKTQLPLLKDLPIDPSTLCKMASSLGKLSAAQSYISAGETVIRILLRLLSSKNGQLLRACPKQDLILVLDAVAMTDLRVGRERIGLFIRRVVQLFNDPSEFAEMVVSPRDKAKLIWAFGQLGVKYRLQLTSDIPLVDVDQLPALSVDCLSKLVSLLQLFQQVFSPA
jgi:hypothetical protein